MGLCAWCLANFEAELSPQGSLEKAEKSAREKTSESKKCSVKSSPLMVDNQVTTGVA